MLYSNTNLFRSMPKLYISLALGYSLIFSNVSLNSLLFKVKTDPILSAYPDNPKSQRATLKINGISNS